jgi:hypothetical protein
MNDIQSILREADPVAREGGASAAASERMRHRIRSGIRIVEPKGRRVFPLLAAAVLFLSVGAAWMTSRLLPPRAVLDGPRKSLVEADEPLESRQLQFFTPGGTRVLWTLHPKLESR